MNEEKGLGRVRFMGTKARGIRIGETKEGRRVGGGLNSGWYHEPGGTTEKGVCGVWGVGGGRYFDICKRHEQGGVGGLKVSMATVGALCHSLIFPPRRVG